MLFGGLGGTVSGRKRCQVCPGTVSCLLRRAGADAAGALRARLEAVGKPIGAYDVLIAGQALRREFTLVTAISREFARVKDLAWEDWSK